MFPEMSTLVPKAHTLTNQLQPNKAGLQNSASSRAVLDLSHSVQLLIQDHAHYKNYCFFFACHSVSTYTIEIKEQMCRIQS